MDWMKTIGSMLPGQAESQFDQITNSAPTGALGGAISDMLRSQDTPPFAELAAQIFGNSSGSQKATVLNELLSVAGSNLPSGLGSILGQFTSGGATADAASQISPEVVQQMAAHAEQQDSSIVDRLGAIYSQHPDLIKTLGSAAVAVTMSKLANRSSS